MDCLPDCSLEFSDLAIEVSLGQTESDGVSRKGGPWSGCLEKEDPGVGA